MPAFNEDGVAELVRSVVARHQFFSHVAERRVIGERPHQLIVARSRFVNAREDRMHDAQRGRWPDSLIRQPWTLDHTAIAAGGMFERANDSRADSHDAAAFEPSALDRESGCAGNV